MKPVPLHEFEIDLGVYLEPKDLNIAITELNLHFFNDTVCNHWVDGKLLAKYPKDLNIAITELNLHFFNDTVCNHWVDGKLLAKYPEIEKANPLINDAYYNVNRGCRVTVIIELMSDGTFRQQ